MRFFSRSILFISAVSILSGCSDSNNSSSSTSNIEGWVGAQGFNNAQVVVNQVAESGQVAVNTNGIYLGLRESTDTQSRFTATVANDETLLFIARGQVADVDKDKNNLATQRQCQVVAGCSVNDVDYSFSSYYPLTSGFEWRGIAYTVNDGSRNNVNPITSLATAYAFQYDVLNYPEKGSLAENKTFTAYDVVLANSQVSKLLGISDIVGDLPANLTKLNNLNSNTIEVRNQIRYGALIAAIQQRELEYLNNPSSPANTDFVGELVAQFSLDAGQFYYHAPSEERLLTLEDLYQVAHDNLNALLAGVTNSQAKSAATQVVSDFQEQITQIQTQPVDTRTTANADDLALLLTASEIEEFDQGLEKTKLFVTSLLDYQQTFWQPDYQSELDTYLAFLKTIGDEHKENLKALVAEFAHIQDYYVTCAVGGFECDTRFSDLDARKTSYDSATKVLKLDNGAITVSQKIADINTQDNIDNPTSSHAVDVFIIGKLEKNGLVLNLEHDLDKNEENIDVPSSMRIYYSEEVTAVNPLLIIKGYELIWGQFEMYDQSKIGSAEETELSGAFRIFYRGVQDPQNTNEPNDSELRFNIEDWVLSSSITDNVDDDNGSDRELTSVIVTATTSNPRDYYPAKKLADFNGFFEANDAHPVGEEVTGLLTYQLGQESVPFGSTNIVVETVDFINSLDKDVRYRFYPDELVKDELDSDGDGNVSEFVDMHRIEECELDENSGNVVNCGPKTKVFDNRNRQNTINDLWELGLFQRLKVAGRGTYFVDFDTQDDANGCKVLSPLEEGPVVLNGRLIEQQVLGLDTVRLFTEIQLENDQLVDLPKTLLDMTVIAPTKDKYRISAALSHNYSGTTSDSSGIILGTGSDVSVLAVGYDTSADFENSGNISVAKGGVTLTVGDKVVTEDQDITAFLTQSYNSADIHYKIIEDEEGQADRCVLTTGNDYVKQPSDLDQVFYLNYRDVVYGTARPEGANNIWTIRYIDGSWLIPADKSTGI